MQKINDVLNVIDLAAHTVGVNARMMKIIAYLETSLGKNMGSEDSMARGLFQFTQRTWNSIIQKYGEAYGLNIHSSIDDLYCNSVAAGLLILDNVQTFMNYGMTFEDANDPFRIYMAHFVGPWYASMFFKNMVDSSTQMVKYFFPENIIKHNPSVFGKDGEKTVSDVVESINNRIRKAEIFLDSVEKPV